jgi:AmpD protein
VPTAEESQKFSQYVAGGFDLSAIDPAFRAAAYLQAGLDPLATPDTAKTLILDPARDARQQSESQGIAAATSNPLGFVVGNAVHAWNYLTGQIPSAASGAWDAFRGISEHQPGDTGIGDAERDLRSFANRVTNEGWGAFSNASYAIGAAVENKLPQAGQFLLQAGQHMENSDLLMTDGLAKGVNDASNLITTAAAFSRHMVSDAISAIPGIPQQIKDQIQSVDDNLTYGTLKFNRDMDNWSDGFSGKAADAVMSLGAATNKLSGISQFMQSQNAPAQIRQTESTFTPAEMSGSRMVMSPLNYLPEAISMRGFGVPIKPAFMSAVDDTEDALKVLNGNATEIASKVNAAQVTRDAQVNGLFGDGGPVSPWVDKNLNDLKANLADIQSQIAQKTQEHQQAINLAGTQLQTNAGLASQIAGRAFQGAGATVKAASAVGQWTSQAIDNISLKLAGGNPYGASAIRHAIPELLNLTPLGTEGIGIDAALTAGVNINKGMASVGMSVDDLGEVMGVIGKELLVGQASSPFFARVAENLHGLPQWAFQAADNSLFNDLSRSASGALNTGLPSGLINAGISYAGSGGNAAAAGQGFVSGALLGMGGGFAKTWRDYLDPSQVSASQVGDRYKFLQSLDKDTKSEFLKYTPEAQLTLGSVFSQNPDLRLRFDAPEGVSGHYEVNSQAKTATIHLPGSVNGSPGLPEDALHLVLQHEVNHHLQAHGLAGDLTAKLLGDPVSGTPGLFAAFDSNGKAIRDSSGNFTPNSDLQEMQNRLAQKYTDFGFPEEAARLTPERTLRELSAESAVGLMSPGTLPPRATLVGKLLDAGVAPFITKNFIKSTHAVLGNAFNRTGENIIGTGLMTGEKRVPLLDNMLADWNSRRKLSPLDSGDSIHLVPKDLIGKDDGTLRNISGNVDAWRTAGGPNGKILRSPDGTPLMRTKKQMDDTAQAIGQTVHGTISRMTDDARLAAGIRADGTGGWIAPSGAPGGIDAIAGKDLSPASRDTLRLWQNAQTVDPGVAVNLRYWAAYERGAFKQPVANSIPIKEHSVTPVGIQITKKGNILLQAIAHDQLLQNVEEAVSKQSGRALGYDSVAKTYDAAKQLIEHVTNGGSSESIVSPEKKKFLYQLTGLDPRTITGENVFASTSKAARSESIWKTFRADRVSRSIAVPSQRFGVNSSTYDQLKGYKTYGKLQIPGSMPEANLGRKPPIFSPTALASASRNAPAAGAADMANAANQYIRNLTTPAAQPQSQAPALRAQPGSIQAQPAAPRALPASGPPQAQPATPYALPASGVPRAQPLNIDRSISAIPGSFTSGRGRMQVQKIVMHSTDGKSAQGDINTLTGHDPSHPVSVHFYVERNGQIHQFVNTGDTAYQAGGHNSSGYNNNNTIGIEQQHVDGKDDWPDAQVRSAARLVAQQLRENPGLSVNDVVGHSQIAPERKQDPVGYPWGRFRQLVQEDSSQNSPQTTSKPPVSRLGMARRIIGLETDLTQGLRIKQLPPGDRSGPGYEVGGITPRWDGATASHLAYLVQNGRQKEAMTFAKNYVAGQTDGSVNQWLGGQANADKHPGLQFAIRDIAWQHGDSAVPRILARALGFNPRFLTPSYVEAAARQDPQGFLNRIKQSRTDYVNIVQQPAANLHQGVLNRVALAHEISSSL